MRIKAAMLQEYLFLPWYRESRMTLAQMQTYTLHNCTHPTHITAAYAGREESRFSASRQIPVLSSTAPGKGTLQL